MKPNVPGDAESMTPPTGWHGGSRPDTARGIDDASSGLTPVQRRMVVDNLPLVRHVVGRLTERMPASYSRDDLVQAGALGLIEATRRFDPELGYTFSTFAGRRIEGAVLDMIRRADWASRSVRRDERRLSAADAELQAALGRRPTDQELSESLNIGVERLHGLRADLARARLDSLDRVAEGGGHPFEAAADDVSRLERAETLDRLRSAIDVLPERHRMVIVGHFFEGRSMTELGGLLGVTQSRASQIKAEALARLRSGLETAGDDRGPGGPSGPAPSSIRSLSPSPSPSLSPSQAIGEPSAHDRSEVGPSDERTATIGGAAVSRAVATWRDRLDGPRSGNDLTSL